MAVEAVDKAHVVLLCSRRLDRQVLLESICLFLPFRCMSQYGGTMKAVTKERTEELRKQ